MDAGKFAIARPTGRSVHIRWADRKNLSVMEEEVELLDRDPEQFLLLSPVCILERTQVYFIDLSGMGSGIVSSCSREGSRFILTLATRFESSFSSPRHEFDPGVMEVDSFLTPEDEERILDSFKSDIPFSVMVQRRILASLNRVGETSFAYLSLIHKKASALFLLAT